MRSTCFSDPLDVGLHRDISSSTSSLLRLCIPFSSSALLSRASSHSDISASKIDMESETSHTMMSPGPGVTGGSMKAAQFDEVRIWPSQLSTSTPLPRLNRSYRPSADDQASQHKYDTDSKGRKGHRDSRQDIMRLLMPFRHHACRGSLPWPRKTCDHGVSVQDYPSKRCR